MTLPNDYEPPCECIPIDADEVNARWCPAHGPDSEGAKKQRQQEADDIWAFYNAGGSE